LGDGSGRRSWLGGVEGKDGMNGMNGMSFESGRIEISRLL
jgi:hypothetical protein